MSIEVNNLRITKLREYLLDVLSEIKEQYNQLNVNFLSNEPENYSLDKIPIATEESLWIIGNIAKRDVYNFRSRMNYSADTISNIENIGFYETFERIIEEKNNNNELPEIDGIQSIKCLNAGTLNIANTNTAEFSIQIQIEYLDNNEDRIISL